MIDKTQFILLKMYTFLFLFQFKFIAVDFYSINRASIKKKPFIVKKYELDKIIFM